MVIMTETEKGVRYCLCCLRWLFCFCDSLLLWNSAVGNIYDQMQRRQHIVNICYCRLGPFSSIVLCFVYFQGFFLDVQ